MLTDSETRGASSHLRSLQRQGCLETQGFLGILERDEIDHMEPIKGGLFFCEWGKLGQKAPEFSHPPKKKKRKKKELLPRSRQHGSYPKNRKQGELYRSARLMLIVDKISGSYLERMATGGWHGDFRAMRSFLEPATGSWKQLFLDQVHRIDSGAYCRSRNGACVNMVMTKGPMTL